MTRAGRFPYSPRRGTLARQTKLYHFLPVSGVGFEGGRIRTRDVGDTQGPEAWGWCVILASYPTGDDVSPTRRTLGPDGLNRSSD
jgi:hypothetical protein